VTGEPLRANAKSAEDGGVAFLRKCSVFIKLLNIFSPHTLGQLRYGTTVCTGSDLLEEDLAALPDLMCGAACEILTSIKREYNDIPEIYSKLPRLASRPQEFLKWYASGPWPLKRYICSFESRKRRAPSLGILHPSLLGRSSDTPTPFQT
jgi:hypothetical protein